MRTKSLMAVVILAALATGCSQNEITEMSPDARPAMNFGVYTGVQTRGEVMDDTWLQKAAGANGGGLGVLAYHTKQAAWADAKASATPNFMYNQKVEYTGGKFAYTPLKYWPNTEGDKISFFAYAPYDTDAPSGAIDNGIVLSANDTQSDPTLTFTLKSAANKLVDLVATDATQTSGDNQVIDVTKRTGDIKFKLNHVLTRATFSAKLDQSITVAASATHVFVTKARILGTDARNDATNTGNSVTGNSNSKFYDKSTYKFVDGTWNYASATKQAAPYDLASVLNTASVSSTVTGYSTQVIEVPQGGTEVSLFKSSPATEYLFLIPPTDNTGITAATDVRVQIDYDIVTLDVNISGGYSITSTTATVSLPNGTLKRAEAYKFTFTIGLNAVTVSAEVAPWTDKGEVFIPSTTAASSAKAAIEGAITALNTAKTNNPNCNYFVIDVTTGTGTVALTSLSATTSAFKSGDKIELNFKTAVTASNSNVSMTGWTVTGSLSTATGKIILTKN